jgi:O-antigen ligase
MTNTRISYWLRLAWALVLIGLEFTNLFVVLGPQLATPRSPYLLEFATYAVGALVVLLNPADAARLIRNRIFKWTLAVLSLFCWGMLVRTFYIPAGIDSYNFLRLFGLQVQAISFMLACVIVFDHPQVLTVVKAAVAVATLLGVALNLFDAFRPGMFDAFHPGVFSGGRAAGLYIDANCSGMALVLGCVISLTAIPRRWRELFLLLTCAGIVVTFSREAILAFAIVVTGGALARAISPQRVVVGVLGVGVLFSALELGNSVRESPVWNEEHLARLHFATSDESAAERLELARDTLDQFETAPIFGHGFGTDEYWGNRAPSHNYFLTTLANYGVLGAFVIPALVLSVRRKSWDSNVFGLIFLVWSFFLHLVLVLPFALIAIAVEAATSAQQKRSASSRAPFVRGYSFI